MLEDVCVKWCNFWVFLGPVISRFGQWSALFFTWGICIDGSLTITLLIPLPPDREMMTQWKKGLRRWEFLSLVISLVLWHNVLSHSVVSHEPQVKIFWQFIKGLRRGNTGIAALHHQGKLESDGMKKSEILNNYFSSVFTKEDLTPYQTKRTPQHILHGIKPGVFQPM